MVKLRLVAMVVGAACLLSSFSAAASPHPFHISLAEMEFNPESRKFEVSLKVHVVDLERDLAKLSPGKKLDLEHGDISQAATVFLNRTFYLLPLADAQRITEESLADKPEAVLDKVARSKAEYVGKELETSWVWLYFELQPPAVEGDLALVNAVFLDSIDKQINTVSVRAGSQRHALKLTRKSPWGKFPREWLEGKDGA